MLGFVSKNAYQELIDKYLNVKAQRDLLNTENAALVKHLAEADAQLQKSVEEIHGLRMQRQALQLKLDEATKPRKRPRAGQPVVVEEK